MHDSFKALDGFTGEVRGDGACWEIREEKSVKRCNVDCPAVFNIHFRISAQTYSNPITQ